MDDDQKTTELSKVTAINARLIRWVSLVLLALFILYKWLVDQGSLSKLGMPDAIVLLVLLLFCSGWIPEILERMKKLSVTAEGVHVELDRIRATQARQQKDLNALTKFLGRGYLSAGELNHLVRLDGDKPYDFEMWEVSKDELRHLRRMELIEIDPVAVKKHSANPELEKHPDWADEDEMPEETDDLREFYKVTEKGKRYLTMRRKIA